MKCIQQFTVGVCSILLASCASNVYLDFHEDPANVPNVKSMKLPKTPKDEIVLIRTAQVTNNSSKLPFHERMSKKRYAFLGKSWVRVWDEPTSIEKLRDAAYALGADTVYHYDYYAGQTEYRAKVPLYKTKGRTITSTSQTQGSYSGTYNKLGSSRYGNINGSYQGQTSNSTYIPGQTVYGYQNKLGSRYVMIAYFYVPFSKMSEKVREEFYDKVDRYNERLGVAH